MQATAVHRLAQATVETWTHVEAAVARGEPADVALQSWWSEHRYYGSRDRRFMAGTIFSAFRWRGWLDLLEPSVSTRLAIAYLLDAVEPHPSAAALLAATPELVDAAPAGHLDLAGKAGWLAKTFALAGPPSPTALVPAWAPPLIDPLQLDGYLRAIQQRPPVWLRTRERDAEAVCALLAPHVGPAHVHPKLATALSLDRTPPSGLLQQLARRGCVVQDLASQCVALACQPTPGQRWWDMCAGAGGKTLHLAELMQGGENILATDVREPALQELDRRARLMGVRGLFLRVLRPDAAPPGGPFDGILVDAPCSGLGTWGRNPDARWRITEEIIHRSAATQLSLLQRAHAHLKPGGSLVYATCSTTINESTAVLEKLAASQPGCWRPTSLPIPLCPQPPLGSLQIWPADGPGIGMFIAKMIKIQ